MKKMIKGTLPQLIPLAVILCLIVLLQSCGKDRDNIQTVELGSQQNITCNNRPDGFFYWHTSDNRCSINCYNGKIKHIQCFSR